MGYLDWDGSSYALFDNFKSEPRVTFPPEELQYLRRVVGVAVPV